MRSIISRGKWERVNQKPFNVEPNCIRLGINLPEFVTNLLVPQGDACGIVRTEVGLRVAIHQSYPDP